MQNELLALKNKSYDDLQTLWIRGLVMEIALPILSITSLFIINNSVLYFIGFLSFIFPILSKFTFNQSDSIREIAERCNRLLLYKNSIDCKISNTEYSTLMFSASHRDIELNSKIDNYFHSKFEIGPKRLLENIHESAFYSKCISSKLAKFCFAITLILLLWFFVIVYFSSLSIQIINLSTFIKITIVLLPFLTCGQFFDLYFKYNNFELQSDKILNSCDLHLKDIDLSNDVALRVAEDYHIARYSAPPLPYFTYKIYADQLNKIYKSPISE